jgi:hypothetical protein
MIHTEANTAFFAMLQESLEEEVPENTQPAEMNQCLISLEPLIDKFVTFSCGHKFNYMPIYNAVNNYYVKEIKHANKLVCPFCRSVQSMLLPFYGTTVFPLAPAVKGINFRPCSQPNCKRPVIEEYLVDPATNEFYQNLCQVHQRMQEKKYKSENPVTITDENFVVGSIHQCNTILQSGKRKGQYCMATSRKKNGTCGRHEKPEEETKNT